MLRCGLQLGQKPVQKRQAVRLGFMHFPITSDNNSSHGCFISLATVHPASYRETLTQRKCSLKSTSVAIDGRIVSNEVICQGRWRIGLAAVIDDVRGHWPSGSGRSSKKTSRRWRRTSSVCLRTRLKRLTLIRERVLQLLWLWLLHLGEC